MAFSNPFIEQRRKRSRIGLQSAYGTQANFN